MMLATDLHKKSSHRVCVLSQHVQLTIVHGPAKASCYTTTLRMGTESRIPRGCVCGPVPYRGGAAQRVPSGDDGASQRPRQNAINQGAVHGLVRRRPTETLRGTA